MIPCGFLALQSSHSSALCSHSSAARGPLRLAGDYPRHAGYPSISTCLLDASTLARSPRLWTLLSAQFQTFCSQKTFVRSLRGRGGRECGGERSLYCALFSTAYLRFDLFVVTQPTRRAVSRPPMLCSRVIGRQLAALRFTLKAEHARP